MQGLWFGVWGSRSRVWGAGLEIWDVRFRIVGFRVKARTRGMDSEAA